MRGPRVAYYIARCDSKRWAIAVLVLHLPRITWIALGVCFVTHGYPWKSILGKAILALWREVAEDIQHQMRRIQSVRADGSVLRRRDRHVGCNRSVDRIERCNQRLCLSLRPQR